MNIGIRLREEREAIGLTQIELAEIGGVKKLTQLMYEKNKYYPSAIYLNQVDKVGIDIYYVITGIKIKNTELLSSSLSKPEMILIHAYRNADQRVKNFILSGLIKSES